MQKFFLSIHVLVLFIFSSCEDRTDPDLAQLTIQVTLAGEVPDYYTLQVYRGDKLVKSDKFDRAQGARNISMVDNALPGPYYLEASTGTLSVKDSIGLFRGS